MIKASMLAIFLFLFSPIAVAENWGHWRGPTGNGTAANAKPPIEWSATKNVKWKADIPGLGSSSPAIWEDRVFVTTAVPVADNARSSSSAQGNSPRQGGPRPKAGRPDTGSGNAGGLPRLAFKLLCFNRKDGKLLWEQTATVAIPHQEPTLPTDSLRHHPVPTASMSMHTLVREDYFVTRWTVS